MISGQSPKPVIVKESCGLPCRLIERFHRMKKSTIFAVLASVVILSLPSCSNFDDLKQNKNVSESAPASLLLNNVLFHLHDAPFSNNERWCQYFLINYDYYGNNRYDFGGGDDYYTTLKNVVQMEKEASTLTAGEQTAYKAMAEFLKAYYFTKMSLEMGNIPMSEALQGVAKLTPKYDTQKAIFQQAFTWLESANTELASVIASGQGGISGDFYLGNNLKKWQKLVNTFRLRLLIHLSKKTDDTDLKVKDQFAKIIADPTTYPVMTSAADNLAFSYLYPSNLYPNNPGTYGYDALRNNCSDTYVGLLTQLKDPRVFITCEPAQALVKAGTSPTSFDAFRGANPGEDLGQMYAKANNGTYSLLNRYHYYRTYTGEPTLEISYQEMCFNIAEAINRGWITTGALGGAEDYYKAGIKASMEYYAIPESGNMSVFYIKQGAGLSDAAPYNSYSVAVDWNAYYNQSAVKYAGNSATGLTQILQQRYLALFRHSGLESYFTYRRTGVPTFETGPGTGNSEKIPLRFQYFDTEKTSNTDNYKSALQEYGGNDNINGTMWILK